jgi:hypothetical protein
MDWRCDSSSKVPALQVQSPEFKWKSHQKKKKSFYIVPVIFFFRNMFHQIFIKIYWHKFILIIFLMSAGPEIMSPFSALALVVYVFSLRHD